MSIANDVKSDIKAAKNYAYPGGPYCLELLSPFYVLRYSTTSED